MACGDKRGCDTEWLCAACGAKLILRTGTEQICRKCGEVTCSGVCSVCGDVCDTYTAVSAYAYDEAVKGIVSAFKFKSVYRMDEWMAGEIKKALDAADVNDFDVITYVPLHITRYNERGYNQSERLAHSLSKKTGRPCDNLLKRVRRTDQQAKLTAEKRRENLHGAFEAVKKLDGDRVLLIDDVRTTGTTAAMCAGELMKAGAKDVLIATFASAEKNY